MLMWLKWIILWLSQKMHKSLTISQLLLRCFIQITGELSEDFHLTVLSQIQTEAPAWTPITTSDIKEQLAILIKAEEDAVAFYKGIVEAARNESDWVTESLAKKHMGDEEKHARDLKRVLESL